jgi:3-keto-5-aminohexanoate cleavage enzyme
MTLSTQGRWGLQSGAPVDQDKVIITCALTGALATREQCSALPYTPVEIADEAKRASDAGASVVHIHARRDDGTPSFESEVFAKIKHEIRQRCDVILNFSTGNLDDDTKPQEGYISEVQPEIAALNMGTMNYAKYSSRRKEFVFDLVFPNTFKKIESLLRVMNQAGVKPELECFDTGHTHSIWPLIDKGLLQTPIQFSFIVGVLGGLPPSVDALMLQARQIPAGSTWEVIGIGKSQWRWVATALILGGNIRVGLEDNFYLPNGKMASGNAELVAKAAQMSRDMGREPATVQEARRLLNLSDALS